MFIRSFSFLRLILILTLCCAPVLAACTSTAQAQSSTVPPPPTLTIVPLKCELPIFGKIGFSLNGVLSNGTVVTWSAKLGLINTDPDDFGATYTAPPVPGEDEIVATVTPGPSGTTETFVRTCIIQGDAPSTALSPTNLTTVSISEVMANPCGGDSYKPWNQYIELYNYGDQPVDVNGWYFFDEGKAGTPDRIVSWETRSQVRLDQSLITNTTFVPSHGFALLLSPHYTDGNMPYPIRPGTVILTIASSDMLGDDYFGLIGTEIGPDTITLYRGSLTVIDQVIDTYGTPLIRGPYPNDDNIEDDRRDSVPLALSECYSVGRVDPLQKDSDKNWVPVFNGTPGDGPYPK